MSQIKGKSKKLYYIFLPFVAILLAVGITVDCLYSEYNQVINGALGESARASEEYVEQTLENSKNVNISLEEEGAVLLKNDGVLPIAPGSLANGQINVYGILSAHHYQGSTGSSSSGSVGVDFKTALESVGYTVNPDIWNLISTTELGYDSGSQVGQSVSGQYELSTATYAAACKFDSAKSYSDYAIVTFGANGGEGADASGENNSLQLGDNEVALLQRLDQEGFKIIALVNGSYVMEPTELMQYADAILWIGNTGLYGPYGVANLIAGNATPSGRVVDTWMYDMKTQSTFYTASNTDSLYVNASGTKLGAYSNYNEGIYIGYRWYETADAEGYWDSDYAKSLYGISNGYADVVAFPFGYGLSYTEFTEEITDVVYEESTGNFTFTVKVKNVGDTYSGKDVVEIYLEKPYTNGGLEVSKVELGAFAKTSELAPGAEETVTLTVYSDSLTSYDISANGGNGSYVLTAGEYKFYLATNLTGAHCWATTDSEDSAHYYSTHLGSVEYSGTNKRSSDYVAATNLLEVTDNYTGLKSNDSGAYYHQLSRKDGFANAKDTISKEANPNGNVVLTESDPLYSVMLLTYGSDTYSNYDASYLNDIAEFTNAAIEQKKVYTLSDLWTTDANGNPLYEIDEETGAKTILGKVDYDDPRWDTLISQMSIAEMEELIGRGGYGTIAVESIEKLSSYEYDGPTGFTNFLKASLGIEQETTGFCSEPIMAASWNVDLIEEYGKAVGMEGNAFGLNGWYAPGMNMHRTTFAGRTGEYFSEDPLITGMMAASVAYGAWQKGVYTYAKHFAFNEIEANRDSGMNCWMSEQTAREIYLKPFEIAIKQGKLTGLMTSFMYLNGQWNGGNHNLVYGIVRNEWNFKGVMNTDLAGKSTMGAARALCGGTDMLLTTSYGQNATLAWVRLDGIKTTDIGICAMKTAVKHILFAYASAALNRDVEVQVANTTSVEGLFIAVNVVAYAGAAILLALFVWRLIVDLRRPKITVEDVDVDAEEDKKE